MSSWQSRLQKIRQNPRGASARDLLSVLNSLDCSIRQGRGSHVVVRHPRAPTFFLVVPNSKRLKRVYVVKTLEAIDELLMELGLEE